VKVEVVVSLSIQFETHSALYADLQLTHFPAKNYMIYCQKVGRLKHIRAVPPLKVGRLSGTAWAVPQR